MESTSWVLLLELVLKLVLLLAEVVALAVVNAAVLVSESSSSENHNGGKEIHICGCVYVCVREVPSVPRPIYIRIFLGVCMCVYRRACGPGLGQHTVWFQRPDGATMDTTDTVHLI